MDEPTVALSSRQYGLWCQERLLTTAAGSASVIGELLVGPLDVQALRKAFGAVVRRHDSLRYRFPDRRGQPYVVVEPPGGVALPVHDCDGDEEAAIRAELHAEARRPFELARGPLWRARPPPPAPPPHAPGAARPPRAAHAP